MFNMLFTTRQRYQSWKDISNSISSIVPANTKPETDYYSVHANSDKCCKPGSGTNPWVFNGPPKPHAWIKFKHKNRHPNPIKQYRKRLSSSTITGSSKISQNYMDVPGGNVNLVNNKKCCDWQPNKKLETYIENKNNTINYFDGKYIYDTSDNLARKCISCTPESNVIKSNIVRINPEIHNSSSQYLQSRCKTFHQLTEMKRIEGNDYFDALGNPLIPTDTIVGPQTYNVGNCCNQVCGTPTNVIFKPSNSAFAHRGPVSGGTRVAKLKMDAITLNGNVFLNAAGATQMNEGMHQKMESNNYFVKQKEPTGGSCKPRTYYKMGNKTMCP
jgi:hypothetical protein